MQDVAGRSHSALVEVQQVAAAVAASPVRAASTSVLEAGDMDNAEKMVTIGSSIASIASNYYSNY